MALIDSVSVSMRHRKICRWFFLIHLLVGILHFPILLLSDVGDLAVILFGWWEKLAPLAANVLIASLIAGKGTNQKSPGKPGAFSLILCLAGGVALSSFLIYGLDLYDEYGLVYSLLYLILWALVAALIDALTAAAEGAVVFLFSRILSRLASDDTEKKLAAICTGVWATVHLCVNELPTTVAFWQTAGGSLYPGEIVYVIFTYLVFFAVGIGAAYFARYSLLREKD